jgi:hypothetical protein
MTTSTIMTQAIVTRFISPTNTRDSRVKATADAGSVTLHWDHALNVEDNHRRAAMALVEKLGWQEQAGTRHGPWVGGGMPNHGGYCFVQMWQE